MDLEGSGLDFFDFLMMIMTAGVLLGMFRVRAFCGHLMAVSRTSSGLPTQGMSPDVWLSK
jgi:hypothetical protein